MGVMQMGPCYSLQASRQQENKVGGERTRKGECGCCCCSCLVKAMLSGCCQVLSEKPCLQATQKFLRHFLPLWRDMDFLEEMLAKTQAQLKQIEAKQKVCNAP